MSLILHITERAAWQAAQAAGEYRAPSLAAQGFIHCATAAQVIAVADAFYRGQAGLVLLGIDPARLAADLRWEPPDPPAGSPAPAAAPGERFPHLYGPLNLEAVVRVDDFPPGPDGRFTLPPVLPRT